MKTIGQRIREKREALGMSQEELANKSGYKSRSSINKIEKDGRDLRQNKILDISKALSTTPAYIMGWEEEAQEEQHKKLKAIRIPVLGMVHAGLPTEAVEDIIDWEEITPDMASRGDIMALQVKGNCMEPRFSEGDVVIVLHQSDVDSGDVAIVMINSHEAEMKKIKKFDDGSINLIPLNPAYQAKSFTPNQIKNLPITILGKVIELRAKF